MGMEPGHGETEGARGLTHAINANTRFEGCGHCLREEKRI